MAGGETSVVSSRLFPRLLPLVLPGAVLPAVLPLVLLGVVLPALLPLVLLPLHPLDASLLPAPRLLLPRHVSS